MADGWVILLLMLGLLVSLGWWKEKKEEWMGNGWETESQK